jgi:arylsulfatase A-like enzyme
VNLAPQLAGENQSKRQPRFLMHFPHSHRSSYFTSFRDGDWKLVYHYLPEEKPGSVRYELFDLAADPYENENLAAARPAVLRKMTEAMIAALESEEALFPVAKNGMELRPVVPQGSL